MGWPRRCPWGPPPSLTAVGGLAVGQVEVHVAAPGVRGVGALRGGCPWGRGPSEPLTARTLHPCSSQEPGSWGCSPGGGPSPAVEASELPGDAAPGP